MSEIDYAARLASVQAAIEKVLSGGVKSYTLENGMSVTKLDLDWLTREEARLAALLRRQKRVASGRGAFRLAAPK